MKRYTVAQARQRLADVLNEADQGGPVVIERRGVRYLLAVERMPLRRRVRGPVVEILDPAVAAGSWTWTATSGALQFQPRRPRRHR